MPKRTLTLSILSASKIVNGVDTSLALDSIDGVDLLDVFRDWATSLDREAMVDRKKEHYTAIRSGRASGRSILLEGLNGRFGSPGVTVDVDTHSVAHRRNDGHAATIPTRSLFVTPPGATEGVFVIERQSNSGSGVAILRAFRDHLAETFTEVTFSTETFQQSDLWIQHADLLSITAIEYARPLDAGDGLRAEPLIGQVETKFRPLKGERSLPRRALDKVRNRTLSENAVIGIPEDKEGTVVVELELDGQVKKFDIDKESAPGFRALLNEDGEPPLSDTDFLDQCRTQVRDCYSRYGLSWEGKWLDRSILNADKFVEEASSETTS